MPKEKDERQSGGVSITGGRVRVTGDIVGRDKIVGTEISKTQINQLFEPLTKAIQTIPMEKQKKAGETMAALKDEIEKGTHASDSVIARLLEGLVELIPNGVAALVKIFATPILAGITGPVTQFVLSKIQGG
jgi:hypothetical protein